MGQYINKIGGIRLGSSSENKCNGLIAAGAVETTNNKFQENLIVVVDNGHFAAAGYCYDEREFEVFNNPKDDRPKRWFILKDASTFVD